MTDQASTQPSDPQTPPPPPPPQPTAPQDNNKDEFKKERKRIMNQLYLIFTSRWTVMVNRHRQDGSFVPIQHRLSERKETLPEGKTFIFCCCCYIKNVLGHVLL
jgi:hypothetical protein